MSTVIVITASFLLAIKGTYVMISTLLCVKKAWGRSMYINTIHHTAFKSQKALLHIISPGENSTKKVVKYQESAVSVEYEDISDSVIIRARQKYSSTNVLHPTPAAAAAAIPATPKTQATPIPPSGTPVSPTIICQQQSQHLEDTLMYATPKPRAVIVAMKQCVPPITQYRDNNIQLTQNSAYQKSKSSSNTT